MSNLVLRPGVQNVSDGVAFNGRGGKTGELIVAACHGRYAEASRRGNVFMAQADVTAPVIWSTEAGTGGPLLWNGSSSVDASLLAVGWGTSIVTTVAGALGITGGDGQSAAPTSTTAIDSSGNLRIGGAASLCTPYRVGTTGTNDFFLPFAQVHTGALTVDNMGMLWVPLDGLITVPPNCFASVAASATLTTLVASICLIWEEIPN